MIKKGLKQPILFESHELSLVSALIAWDFPILKVEKNSTNRVTFFFELTPLIEQSVSDYWNDTKLVSPKKYFSALREAKSRIYSL